MVALAVRPAVSAAITLSVRGMTAPGALKLVEKLPSQATVNVFVETGVVPPL
jgi:hypothetical protein